MAPLYTHILGAGGPPGRRPKAWRSDRDSHRRAQRATGPRVAPWKAGWPSSRPCVSWVDGLLSGGRPGRRGSESSSWPPLPSMAPAGARRPAARAGAVLQVDVRKQDRLIAQGIQQILVVGTVALAVSFHLPVLPHLHQAQGRACNRPGPPALHGRHTRRQSRRHRPGHRCRRAPPDRLAVAVPLCLSWSLSLLAAPELRPFDILAHDRAWLRDYRPLHSLGLKPAGS